MQAKFKYCVTGSNGHLARNLIQNLSQHHEKIIGTIRSWDRKSTDLNCEWRQADLLDIESLKEAFQDCHGVFHIAAPNQVGSKNSDLEIYQPIFQGTKNVLQAAQSVGVKKIVMTSSVSAMGLRAQAQDYFTENDWNHSCASLLLKAKVQAEAWAWENHQKLGIEFSAICVPSLLGPGFRRSSAMIEVFAPLAKGFLPILPDVGFHILDVRDAAEAHRLAMAQSGQSQRYCVAGEFFRTQQLLEKLREIFPELKGLAKPLPDFFFKGLSQIDGAFWRIFATPRKLSKETLRDFLQMNQKVSTLKAQKQLAWKPQYSSEATFKDLVDWLRAFS